MLHMGLLALLSSTQILINFSNLEMQREVTSGIVQYYVLNLNLHGSKLQSSASVGFS